MATKKCDTCEQRWLVYLGYDIGVEEITISHETEKTVTVYKDRGVLGASTRRQDKVTEHERIVKTEAEAWLIAREYAASKIAQINELLARWQKYDGQALEGYDRATKPAVAE